MKGLGIAVISTSKGVMTDRQADVYKRQLNVYDMINAYTLIIVKDAVAKIEEVYA